MTYIVAQLLANSVINRKMRYFCLTCAISNRTSSVVLFLFSRLHLFSLISTINIAQTTKMQESKRILRLCDCWSYPDLASAGRLEARFAGGCLQLCFSASWVRPALLHLFSRVSLLRHGSILLTACHAWSKTDCSRTGPQIGLAMLQKVERADQRWDNPFLPLISSPKNPSLTAVFYWGQSVRNDSRKHTAKSSSTMKA